jgi:uncharacterized protein (DUF1499 family)
VFVLKGLWLCILLAFVGFAANVRLAHVDPSLWNIDLADRHAPLGALSPDQVKTFSNGAYVDLTKASLEQLDTIAISTPRTRRIAGSVEAGRITWETRSLLWGFPDYTTAQVSGEGLTVLARSRYGSGDWGVNEKRLSAWISLLQQH